MSDPPSTRNAAQHAADLSAKEAAYKTAKTKYAIRFNDSVKNILIIDQCLSNYPDWIYAIRTYAISRYGLLR